MLHFVDNSVTYQYNKCQQCGVCKAICPKHAISFELQKNGTHKVIVDNNKCIRCKRCVNSCPANKCEEYKNYFDSFKYKKYFLGYNSNDKVRRESSSGGVCKTLIIEGLRSGYIDGVYTLKRQINILMLKENFIQKRIYPIIATCQILYIILLWHVLMLTE